MTNPTPESRFAADLFGRPPAEEDAPERKPNFVGNEGGNPPPPPDEDAALREYVSVLFGRGPD